MTLGRIRHKGSRQESPCTPRYRRATSPPTWEPADRGERWKSAAGCSSMSRHRPPVRCIWAGPNRDTDGKNDAPWKAYPPSTGLFYLKEWVLRMFFLAAKTIGVLIVPSNVLVILCLTGALLNLTRHRKFGIGLMLATAWLLFFCSFCADWQSNAVAA